jgi:hypothetical protein
MADFGPSQSAKELYQPCSFMSAVHVNGLTVVLQYKRLMPSIFNNSKSNMYFGYFIDPTSDDPITRFIHHDRFGFCNEHCQPAPLYCQTEGVPEIVRELVKLEGPADDLQTYYNEIRRQKQLEYRAKKNREAEKDLLRKGLSIR